MQTMLKSALVGALALAGAAMAADEARAMPVAPLAPAAEAQAHVDQVYWYGYRRPFIRRWGYGYRPLWGGYRRFGYGYGWRRPYWGWRGGWRRW